MFCYLVLLLLVNTYSSQGFPVRNSPVSIAASLQLLASKCENKFISKQIVDNLSYCNESMKLHSKQEIMCLMFFDINRQLCANNVNIQLNDDTSNKIADTQERKSLCDAAQTWTFGNLQEYPEYKQLADIIFRNQEKCIGACAVVDDIVSDDSNYHCKYYKWGTDLLKEQKMPKPITNAIQHDSKPINHSVTSTTINNMSKAAQEVNIDNIKMPISNITSESSPISSGEAQKSENTPAMAIHKPDATSNKNEPKQDQEVPPKKSNEEEKETAKGIIERPLSDEKDTVDNAKAKPVANDIEEDLEDDDEHDEDSISDTLGANEPDGEDQGFNSDPKIDLDKTKSIEKKIEGITVVNVDISNLPEYFPESINDTFDENDADHFFPFFMTAIIVVVVLYILYHNKSKCTKLILGLIVEGRQSGRRRNSRGHTYRRLDTLEQAMSTDTAAPPSKIIY